LIPLEGLNVRPFEVGSGKFGTLDLPRFPGQVRA